MARVLHMSCLLIAALGLLIASALPATADEAVAEVTLVMVTEAGDMQLTLYPDKAPLTVANFLAYVDRGDWTGADIYRVVRADNDNGAPKIEVIQGGLSGEDNAFTAIRHETTELTGIRHLAGTISMARGDPGTAAEAFFICLTDQPSLDFGGMRNPDGQGFAAFGMVTGGLDIARTIQDNRDVAETDDAYVLGQILTSPVKILSITRNQ